MDSFGFSADMLPKLSLLFSGYYVISERAPPGMSLFVNQGTKAEVGTKAEAGRGDIRHAADERRHEVGR